MSVFVVMIVLIYAFVKKLKIIRVFFVTDVIYFPLYILFMS